MCLNFAYNLAVAVSVCNRRCGVIRCSLQLSGTSSLDLVAKNGSLAIGNGRDAGRGRTAFLEGLLKRAAIYYTPWFADRFEQRARSNVSREIAALNRV